MTLRTVNPYTSYQVLLDLQRTKDRIANLQEQLASGNRLNRLGDDPTASALVLDFQTSINRNKAYMQQAETAISFLKTSETSLSSLNDSITRLLELGQQGLTDTTGPNGRTAISHEVDGLRTNILSISNTQSQGKYIFAGTLTTTQPFSGPSSGPIVYAGNSASIDLDVSLSSSVSTNLTGDSVFFGGGAQGSPMDLFQQVTDLRDGLTTNNRTLIQSAYNNLKAIQGNINNLMTDLGGRQASLEQLTTSVQDYNLSLQTIQGSYQDLDYPEAITDYSQSLTSQEASLSVLAKSNGLNLFNYLG